MKRLLVSILLIVIINQFLICICHPIFTFDLFGSTQTTTQESVVSDYRHQKKTDSSLEHTNLMLKNMTVDEPSYTESNVDFYAEILGRLVGSVRSSFSDLIGDIRKRKQYFRERNEAKEKSENADEKLSLEAIMKQLEAHFNDTSLNSTNDELEMMSRKTKRNPFIDDIGDTSKVGQLTIPINLSPFDYDLISEEAAINGDMSKDEERHWLTKYYQFFEQLKENHHNRKEKKLMKLFKLILTPVLQLNKTEAEDEGFDNDDIMFNIIQGNRTIGQLTPFQILRILHKESNDRIQLRMKLILKRIVYKYARLYYIARKNYKNSHVHSQDLHNEENDNFRLLDDSLSDNDINDFDFSTNHGRHNFQSVEGLAIYFLEIFGALFALTIGLWAQMEGGYFYELLE